MQAEGTAWLSISVRRRSLGHARGDGVARGGKDKEIVAISRGENRGKEITYSHPVRELTPIGMWKGETDDAAPAAE